jgi:hypothetical protein
VSGLVDHQIRVVDEQEAVGVERGVIRNAAVPRTTTGALFERPARSLSGKADRHPCETPAFRYGQGIFAEAREDDVFDSTGRSSTQ